MAEYYAHSNFTVKTDDYGVVRDSIKPGQKISRQKLGVSEEDWQDYINMGLVSEEPYPDIPDDVPPNEHYRQLANMDAVISDTEELRMNLAPAPPTVTEKVAPAEGK